ncbi:phosphoglycerate mutase-like protein [Jaminaea rosea]|uniref:Phosphoglycerate mutase-like protein n=1 Tax=Jaminaea rosea TaxID=1569628 RepID=A0A316USA2_9BASI|nr:phosphoglycerate mutase-like protein [Jaminaea rosea]PWN27201.1 phosphoglycerate mutase-like protein [Jaminaea rosea]
MTSDPSSSAIPLPPPCDDPRISAVHPTRPWPWTRPVAPSTSSSDASSPSSTTPLELVQVHYYIRHGERVPVRTRLLTANPPLPERWALCFTNAQPYSPTVLAAGESSKEARSESMPILRVPESVEPTILMAGTPNPTGEGSTRVSAPLRGECLLGELTDRGRASTLKMGQHLRSVYVDQLGLLPAKLAREDEGSGLLYVRSTNMPRTTESATQVIKGLLSLSQDHSSSLSSSPSQAYRPTIFIRNGHQESLLPNTYSCPTLARLDAHFSRQAARLLNPWLSTLDPLIAPHLSKDGSVKLRVDGHPRLSGVTDSLRCAKAHSMPVPAPMRGQSEALDKMEAAVCAEWFGGYSAGRSGREEEAGDGEKSKVFRRLAMGPLLRDLQWCLDEKAASSEVIAPGENEKSEKVPLRMAIYSTHDTTLAGMLATLDLYDGRRWPAFTASVGVELWKQAGRQAQPQASSGAEAQEARTQHFVRLLYDGRPVRMPWCAPASSPAADGGPELCPLDMFRAKVNREVNEGRPRDAKSGKVLSWDEECVMGRGERSDK